MLIGVGRLSGVSNHHAAIDTLQLLSQLPSLWTIGWDDGLALILPTDPLLVLI